MIAEFVVNDLQEAEKIANELRQSELIESSTVMVAFSSAKFPFLSQIQLEELLRKTDD